MSVYHCGLLSLGGFILFEVKVINRISTRFHEEGYKKILTKRDVLGRKRGPTIPKKEGYVIIIKRRIRKLKQKKGGEYERI